MEKYIGLLFGIIGFIYFSYTGVTREKIESENDLTEIKGTFSTYSFKDRTGSRKQGRQYYIWLENYQNAFQIKADYLGGFDKNLFVSSIKKGDDIKITFPKAHLDRLNSEENVMITSIKANRKIYLSQDDTLKKEEDLASSNMDYYLAFGFLIVGGIKYMMDKNRTTANQKK